MRRTRVCALFAALLLALPVAAAPRVRCQITQGGATHDLEFKPVSDPYTVAAVDIGGRFRFKAVLIGDEHKIDYFKTYVYAQNSRQPVLLHSAHFPAPAFDSTPRSLTGMVYVYSPRQLQYECSVYSVATP